MAQGRPGAAGALGPRRAGCAATQHVRGVCAAEGASAATRDNPVSRGITSCAQGHALGLSVAPRDPRFRAFRFSAFGRADSWIRFLERVYDLFGAALERNREEWMLRLRRMGSCPCKQPGRPIARFHSNPSGRCLAGLSAALRRLPIAGLLAAHRALHPIPARYLRGPEKIVNTFFGTWVESLDGGFLVQPGR